MKRVMTTYLLVLIVFLGSTNAEDAATTPSVMTDSDGKPCNSGTMQGNQCLPNIPSTEKPSTMVSIKGDENEPVITKEDEFTTMKNEIEPTTFNDCKAFLDLLLKECQYSCDNEACTDINQYNNLDICQSHNCTSVCTEILQNNAEHCTISSPRGFSTSSVIPQTTTDPSNPFIVSTNPSTAAPLLSLTTIIAIAAAVVVLIISVLILIVLILFLVLRRKTKLIQQRHEDPQAMERYVTKEFESFSETNKDPLYDTIDETIFNTSTNLAIKGTTTSSGTAAPAASHSIAVPIARHSRNGTQNEKIPAAPRLPDRRYTETTGDIQVNEVPLTYEEPVSSLRNSVSHTGHVARQIDNSTSPQPATSATPGVEAQYSILEECTTTADASDHPQTCSLNNTGQSDTEHMYAILEPPHENTLIEDRTI